MATAALRAAASAACSLNDARSKKFCACSNRFQMLREVPRRIVFSLRWELVGDLPVGKPDGGGFGPPPSVESCPSAAMKSRIALHGQDSRQLLVDRARCVGKVRNWISRATTNRGKAAQVERTSVRG